MCLYVANNFEVIMCGGYLELNNLLEKPQSVNLMSYEGGIMACGTEDSSITHEHYAAFLSPCNVGESYTVLLRNNFHANVLPWKIFAT